MNDTPGLVEQLHLSAEQEPYLPRLIRDFLHQAADRIEELARWVNDAEGRATQEHDDWLAAGEIIAGLKGRYEALLQVIAEYHTILNSRRDEDAAFAERVEELQGIVKDILEGKQP